MATSMASDKPSLVLGREDAPDPFVSSPSVATNHRYGGFDSQIFALGPGASPTSAKRALEAHLADTERRMEEAGKLGTALVQQRKELEERLKEVEQLEAEDELSPLLKQRLMVIEKDFNEVARDSARAFLPKQRIPSNEANPGMPYTPDKSAVRRSISPSKFEVMATGSPSKFSVPNRKLRNQPANRVHDIEFAAEISTSLITQVRNLQSLLQEREEQLKDVKAEKSGLEGEVESFQQRMKNLDENESRYKDENWNLETQVQELMAAQKEAADREKKLSHTLNALQADKNSTQRELDEIKTVHSKLAEDHAAAVKHHDIELGMAKRNAVMAESERAALQRKIDELTNQNQELANAISAERGRASQRNSPSGSSEEDLENAGGNMTPEHSPPPSPIKPTPRHSLLETETLKTSLQHAQRTLQSLRTNVHREKTEKLELKRLLQDARDEIEKLRSEPVERPHQRRAREAKSREFKKPTKLDKLGTARPVKAEILHLEDPEWEEVATQKGSPTLVHPSRTADVPVRSTETDEFETANEVNETTDAFETAHERGTETEDFQTGAEDFSDTETETESPSKRAGELRANALKRAPIFAASSQDYSYESTASTSASEDEDYMDPTRTPTSPLKMRMRASRGIMTRRSRQLSEDAGFQSSPASNLTSSFSGPSGMPQQSLFAELGDLDGSDEDSLAATPASRRSIRSVTPVSTARGPTASPAPPVPALPRAIMVDSGMMTDPVDVQPVPAFAILPGMAERPTYMDSVVSAVRGRPPSTSYSDASAQHDSGMEEKLTEFPSPPTSRPSIGAIPIPILPPPQRLGISSLFAEEIEPRAEPEPESALPPRLGLSRVFSEHVEPVAESVAPPPTLSMSHVIAEDVEPIAEPDIPPPPPPVLSVSPIAAESVEPVVEPPTPPPTLAFSSISSLEAEPVAEPAREPEIVRIVEYMEAPKLPPAELSFSAISSAAVEPVAEPEREPETVRVIEYVEAPKPPPADLSFSVISSAELEPMAEPEREPEIVRVVEYVEAPKPPPADLSFSALLSEGIEPQAEPEAPIPPLSMSSITSEDVEPKPEPQPHPPALSVSSIITEHVEPRVEPEEPKAALSVSHIVWEHTEPKAEPAALPAPLSMSSITSEQVEPVIPVEREVLSEKPAPAALDFAKIQSLETTPVEPESPLFVKSIIPPLRFSGIKSWETEPTSPRSPKRNAFILPRDEEQPTTPSRAIFASALGRGKGREPETPFIAEDDTRQSINDTPLTETPESQRPFKEISANTNVKPTRKAPVQTSDSGAQTSLTSETIDQILHAKHGQQQHFGHQKSDSLASASSMGTPGTVRIRRSQESLDAVARSKGKMVDTGIESAAEAALRRPGSAASNRASLRNAPPLPPNHREVIEAARTGTANSGHGTIGSMGPPLFPASAYKNHMTRPKTPVSAVSVNTRGNPMLRPERLDSAHGTADVHSPTRLTARSRKSSVSSFVSEVDHRFNIHSSMGMDPHGFGPNTDPRMIQAITQTMIGEYLWKYTRKAGRSEMSDNRHRRYFWVHPYTRTLYWSDRDPTSAGRAQLRAKSIPIEAVRVVTDNNPMPPGLHRKSLVIISPGRSVKFTCTTGQRHETWFNALSYLLLRTNSEGQADTEEMVNGITREDVDEFNPSYGRRPAMGTRRPTAPSISSYNSKTTTRHGSTMNMDVPTLTPTHKQTTSTGTVSRPTFTGRLSGYFQGTLSSIRSRSGNAVDQMSMYSNNNNEVVDSAEELRLMYERQDRDSDRLDNVRACCEGRHDVTTLTRNRGSRLNNAHEHVHSHPHSHPSRSSTPLGGQI